MEFYTVAHDPSDPRTVAINTRIGQLRRQVAERVLAEGYDASASPVITDLRTKHLALADEITKLTQRGEELGRAKQEYEGLEVRSRSCEDGLGKAKVALYSCGPALGGAVCRAVSAGAIQPPPCFAQLISATQRIGQLRQESDQSKAADGASVFGRARAMAKQLLIAGKVKLEEMKLPKLEALAGSELIAANQEDVVTCDGTAGAIKQVKDGRQQVAEWQGKVEQARNAVQARKAELCQRFSLASIVDSGTLASEMDRCRQGVGQKKSELATFDESIPSVLQTTPDLRPDATLGQFLSDLAQAEAELRQVTPAPQQVAVTPVQVEAIPQDPRAVNLLRVLTQVVLSKEDCSCRQYSGKNIDIAAVLNDTEDLLTGRLGVSRIERLHENDCWTYALGDRGGMVISGQPGDLKLRVYVATSSKGLASEMTKKAAVAAVAFGTIGAVAAGATVAATAGMAAPLAVVFGLLTLERKGQMMIETAELEQGIANEIDQIIKCHQMARSQSVQLDIPGQIKKLAELRESGVLTEDEFTKKKTELLSRM